MPRPSSPKKCSPNKSEQVHEAGGQIGDALRAQQPVEVRRFGMRVVVDQHGLTLRFSSSDDASEPRRELLRQEQLTRVVQDLPAERRHVLWLGTGSIDQRAPEVDPVVGVPLDVEVDLDVRAGNGDRAVGFALDRHARLDHRGSTYGDLKPTEGVPHVTDLGQVGVEERLVCQIQAGQVLDGADAVSRERVPFPDAQPTGANLVAGDAFTGHASAVVVPGARVALVLEDRLDQGQGVVRSTSSRGRHPGDLESETLLVVVALHRCALGGAAGA